MAKIALITGGSRGLGRSGALALAQAGVEIILTYQNNADAAQTVVHEIEQLGGKATALQLDVMQLSSFDAFVSEVQKVLHKQGHQGLDILINNAGFGVHAPLSETTEEQFDALLNVHLKGPFFLTQKLLPYLNQGARILNLSTGLTRFSFPGYGAYAAMKGAVEVWTHYLAKELGQKGITANTLAPGAIATDFGGGAVRDNPGLQQMIASQTALGRVGESEDIGPLMAALVNDTQGWVTGQRIEASGGMFI